MGARSTYTDELANEIIERLSEGEPLRQICRDPHMPSWMSVYRWMDANADFALRIARARELGEDAIAQECFDIADNAANDYMERSDNNGGTGWQLNGEHIQRSKLRIETRLKLLAKWNPKKYGEKVTQTVEGGDKPVQIDNVSEVEAARRVAFLLTKAAKAKD